MSKSNTAETNFLALIFNATTWNGFAENDTTSPNTQVWVALHTADPGEAGTGTTNECNFTSYARVAVNRNSGGWTVSGNQVSNTADITFPACTGGSNVPTHFSITVASSGASDILFKGALTPNNITVSNGVTFRIPAGTLVITED